jgi:UDP-glucose 4-epimerase|tara:strand:- start:2766 stop:3650 length:885 start_codon:yes stop_codon:yes gene_type:complete
MNIAVTGATGSIGRELIPFIKSLGHDVYIISSSIPSDGKLTFSYEDIKNNNICITVDIIIHLASLNSNLDLDSMDQELQITEDILSSLPGLKCKKLIFFSSAKVYGDNSMSDIIFDENSELQPSCFYGEAKKRCEELISMQSVNSVSSVIFRLPPFLSKSSSSNLGKLMYFSKLGIPLPIFRTKLKNQRSFISLNNIKAAIKILLDNPLRINDVTIYNLADESFISLTSLLKISGKGRIFTLPKIFSTLILRIPFLRNIFIKLYGNFALDNSKIKQEMGVKLTSTSESMITLSL